MPETPAPEEPDPLFDASPAEPAMDELVGSAEVEWGQEAADEGEAIDTSAAFAEQAFEGLDEEINVAHVESDWGEDKAPPSSRPNFSKALWRAIRGDRERKEAERLAREGPAVDTVTVASGPVGTSARPNDPKKRRVRLKSKSKRIGPGPVRRAARAALPPVLVAAGIAVAVLAVPLRETVVRVVPDLAGLYALADLEVNVRGIELSGFVARRESVAGLTVMEIEGVLTNASERDRPVAPIRMALVSIEGEELFAWSVEPPQSVLPAGETLLVTSELTAPPPNAGGVAVRFLRSDEQVP